MESRAYPLAWPQNTAMRQAASRWQKQGFITPGQHAAIDAAYPIDYYRPNVFVRIGLFIFTCLGAAASAGVVALFSQGSVVGVCLVCGAGAFFVLEQAIKSSRHYHSGFDNALLYSGLLAVAVLLGYAYAQLLPGTVLDDFSPASPRLTLLLLPLLALLLAAGWRYADQLVAALAYLTYLTLVANLLLQLSLGRVLLPFAVMLASAAAYLLCRRLLEHTKVRYYYKPALTVVRVLAIVTFYLGGNYLVVREGNAALNNLPESIQIPFAPLFYLTTVAIPLLYIVLGLRRHNRLLLLVGLFVVGFSLYTYRHYRSLLPPEIAATLAGVALIVFAVWALRYLRRPRHGLSSAAEEHAPPHFNLESLIVAQTAEVPTHQAPAFEFGGGESGGGGATGRF
jgi:hypothetical protein